MKHNTFFIAFALATSAILAGCGGGDGDDISITIEGAPTTPITPTTPTTGDCSSVTEASFVSFNNDCSVGTVSGVIDTDYTFIESVEWVLDGGVVVGAGNILIRNDQDVDAIKAAGVTLTVEAGTEVKAEDDGLLIVTRGSKLMAEGSASAPITFSSLDLGYDGLGEWGGVVIQGFAPHFGQGGTGSCFGSNNFCNVAGEGGTLIGNYGGNDDADNSGVLRYVRIAEGGLVAGPGNEVNGLTFQSVGHATTVEYVQVHNNLDDAVEWFGGTVNAKYLVLTSNDDDGIDFDEGYRGNIQYAIVKSDSTKTGPTGSNDPRAIEANSSDDEYVPETEAVLSNITLIGGPVNNVEGSQQPGARLRGAVNVKLFNVAIKGFDTGCIRIDDADIDGDSVIDENSVIDLTNVLNDCDDGIYDTRDANNVVNVVSLPLSLSNTYAIQETEAVLASAPTIVSVDNGSNFVFDDTAYIGAVDPSATTAWWEGWIIEGSLD